MGDAICSFNPIYGQGMSAAALEAVELARTVANGTDAVGRRFFKRAAAVVETPWMIAAGSDLRMPEAVGRRSAAMTAVNAYMVRLRRAAQHDTAVALAFFRVANLLAPPQSLFRPSIALGVLRSSLPGLAGAHVTGQPAEATERA
jgi:2-polyprenyl-6-methoxyphenol hydroxylase-like FAD-dependent oxidoreductase